MIRLANSRFAFAGLALSLAVSTASATPSLVIDVSNGEVLQQEDAARPWFPASLTKLMTTYVALKAVREGRITLDTPLVVSMRAARMPPSKMGFNPGTEVTLDNALKMLMVKSPNDVAVTIAEGVSGSVEDFATEMNAEAARLGMRDSHFVNPNGLHDPNHVSSARDMAIVGLALLRDFPEERGLFSIGALRLGNSIIPTHNGMLGRYPGADGMKTGFTCPAGFNVVATATHGGRKLLVVIMGSPNAKARTVKAMGLLENAFNSGGWGHPSLSSLPYLGPVAAPNMRPEVCGRNRAAGADEDFAIPIATSARSAASEESSAASFFAADTSRQTIQVPAADLLRGPRPAFVPVDVFVGRVPGYNGPVAQPRGMPPTAVASVQPKETPVKTVARKPVISAAKPVVASVAGSLGKPKPAAATKTDEDKKPAAKVAKSKKPAPAKVADDKKDKKSAKPPVKVAGKPKTADE